MIIMATWSLIGILLGIIFVTVLPWVSARMIGIDAVEKVSSWYVWLAQTCITKSAMIIRPGSVDLVKKRYDPDQKADKDTAGGEPRHHRDTLGGLRSLANKPFGLALHDTDEYVTPLLAEIGDEAKSRLEREEIGAPIDGESTEMYDGIPVTSESEIVDVRDAAHVVTGDADPEDGHRSYQKTVISQEKFHERMTFGQTLIIVGAFLASAAVMWLLASQDAPSAGSVVSGWSLALSRFVGSDGDDDDGLDTGLLSAIGFSGMMLFAVPVIAFLTHGLVAAGLVVIASAAIAIGYPVGIALFGPSLPGFIGAPLARINWTLAQLTVGQGVLVERDTGHYEHHKLLRDESTEFDFVCKLDDGEWLGVNGSIGDMVRFGWEPLAITAEKSEENLGNITSSMPKQAVADGGEVKPQTTRRGYQPVFADGLDADWLVTLPQLWKWVQGSAESEAIREGRDTALTQQGGQQQISYTIYIVMLGLVMLLGGAFGLVAGGAI